MMLLGSLSLGISSYAAAAPDPDLERPCFNQPCKGDLIDIKHADSTYAKLSAIEDVESVFYTANVRHSQALRAHISSLENYFLSKTSISVLDKHGLLVMTNNSSFALANLMSFYVSYAAASKIRDESLAYNHKIKVNITDFNGDYSGPLFQALVQSNFLLGPDESVQVVNSDEPVPNHKARLIGNDWLNTSATKNIVTDFEIPLSDLMYYGLNEGDATATSLLLYKFLDGENDLEKFLKSKGVTLKHLDSSKSLAYRYALSTYDNAKLLSSLINDRSLQIELKDMMLQAMRFAPRSQGAFSEGIKRALTHRVDMQDKFGDLKIFDLNCIQKDSEHSISASSLAYIEFLGEPYIISIHIYKIAPSHKPSEQVPQELLDKLGFMLFDHILKDHWPTKT